MYIPHHVPAPAPLALSLSSRQPHIPTPHSVTTSPITPMPDLELPLVHEDGALFLGTYCPNSRQTLRIAINLKLLIDKVIPVEFDEHDVLKLGLVILTDLVVELARKAAGGKGDGEEGTLSYKYRACLIYCLLQVTRWYQDLAETELSDGGLYRLRATVAQTIALRLIELEKRDQYLFLGMLCHRYTINLNETDQPSVSALELAVDMHLLIVISCLGYQRCMKWLWRGWIVQLSQDPHLYVYYKKVALLLIMAHFDPDRIKTPLYQNMLEIFFSMIYLVLFTLVLNLTVEDPHNIAAVEWIFYLFTLGFVLDEWIKFYHVGWSYLTFWNVFSDCTYTIIFVLIIFRFASVEAGEDHDTVEKYYLISYRVLACAAPFMWTRLLLFLDAQAFVGAMIVVIKAMMKESLLFFLLLFVVIIGFLQGFLGLDMADGRSDKTKEIFILLLKGVIGGGFELLEGLAYPYALVLQYIYTFLLTVILMNILIALYSTSYSNITESATEEYFALVSQKTLRYIRAPDEDLYVPPLNLVEVVISPLLWFVSKSMYKAINRVVMTVLYAPMLTYVTVYELSNARRIQYNRYKGLPDDANEINVEWDLKDGFEVLTSLIWEGIRERNLEIAAALADQREGENQDPEFSIDIDKFTKDVDKVAQPVDVASQKGIPWELYGLYERVDRLTELVEKVLHENEQLRKQLSTQKSSSPSSSS